jgi:nucleoside-diphosphate kinase
MKERSLILIKPDAVCQGKIGEVLREFEKNGLKIVALKMVKLSEKDIDEFYAPHRNSYFFPGLKEFMLTAPCVVGIVEGEDAVAKGRKIIGARVPQEADPNSIRGRWGSDGRRNIVHGSDSLSTSQREILCFFEEKEIFNYHPQDWLKSQPG